MSKYIIDTETWSNLFEAKKVGIYGIGIDLLTNEKTVWSRMFHLDELEELNSDYINEHYGSLQDEAYKQGYKDAERIWRAPSSDNEFYQKGLEDAWMAVRKIVSMPDDPYWELFGDYKAEIIKNTTASEVIAKLKAYEDKQKEKDRIEVGDEVRFLPNDRIGIVTACHVPDVYAENDKYAVFCGTTVEYALRQHITKTGKHYDIASILEAMRNDR